MSQPIRVRVDLVCINALVLDPQGHFITGLTRDQFIVEEEGVRQSIVHFSAVEEPFRVVLALDTSRSMQEKMPRIQQEAMRFVEGLRSEDEVALVSFDDQVQWKCEFTPDRTAVRMRIQSLRTGESTQVYEAVWDTLRRLREKRGRRQALVLFSDGVDTASRQSTRKYSLTEARYGDTVVYPICYHTLHDSFGDHSSPGLKTGPGIPSPIPIPLPPGVGSSPYPRKEGEKAYREARRFLQDLARTTGGRFYSPDSLENLSGSFCQVAAELRSQYSLGYISRNPERGSKFRKINVRVLAPHRQVRTREGYFPRVEE